MSNNKLQKKILVPQYVRKFQCIAERCEDSCCKGWGIEIDRATYKKYKNLKRGELSLKIDNYVTRNRNMHTSDDRFAKIKMINGKCPFQDESKLCMIQSELGIDRLSVVCKVYPRIINLVDGCFEKSLTMSCPEAAKLALLNKEKMQFDQYTEEIDIEYNNKNINTREVTQNVLAKYMWDLRIFAISVLQNREYSIEHRLIILGLLCDKIQKMTDCDKNTDVLKVIDQYEGYIKSGILVEFINDMPVNYTVQFRFLKEMADKKLLMGVSSEEYMQYFEGFLRGIGCVEGAEAELVINNYKKAIEEQYKPFMKMNSHILENYLVNYVFAIAFPYSSTRNLFDSYMMIVINYSMIKMLLAGVALYNDGITPQIAVDVIQKFSKAVEHSKEYQYTIERNMLEHKYNTMPYMSVLLKN